MFWKILNQMKKIPRFGKHVGIYKKFHELSEQSQQI